MATLIQEIDSLYNEDYFLKLQTLDTDELISVLNHFLTKYVPPEESKKEMSVILNKAIEIFNIGEENNYDIFKQNYFKSVYKITVLNHVFAEKELLLGDTNTSKEYLIQINLLFESLYYWNHFMSSLYLLQKRSDRTFDGEINIGLGLIRFKTIDTSNYNSYQKLLTYLMGVLLQKQYRRQGDQCMKRIYTEDGFDTHAWEPVISIKDFIFTETQREINEEQWENSTNKPGNVKSAEEYLKNTTGGIYFPDVIKDRKLFSFKNGLYESAVWDEENKIYVDRWYPHVKNPTEGMITSKDISSYRSACKYFDQEFIYEEYHDKDWYSIPTPEFQSILEYQEFPEEICKWMYIFCGRLLYELNDLDEWQIMPFLMGKAQTGKSTILTRVCKLFFHSMDVAVLSNNCEKTFGLSSLVDKFMFIGPEIKGNLGLEQAEFQQIISGEDTNINKKFQTAKPIKWNVPGIIAGNQPPQYQDNQGSVARRLPIFLFKNKVTNGDARLGQKLENTISNILYKCNRAYLEAVNKFGNVIIWTILPDYFKETTKIMSEQTNSLIHFLNSDRLRFDPELYCPQQKFVQVFKEYCSEHNFRKCPFRKDYYEGPFEDYKLYVKRVKKFDKDENRMRTQNWIFGIDINTNDDTTTSDEKDPLNDNI